MLTRIQCLFMVMVTVPTLILTAERAWSLTLFGIQFGDELHSGHIHDETLLTFDCSACHVNPTGGGLRHGHGREFSIEKLPMQESTEEIENAVEAAQIGSYLSMGADLRFAYLRAEQESTAGYKDSFFPMQADFYLAFEPTDRITLYYQDGVQASGSRETFLLLHRLPFNSDVKIGRFIPPYGLKLDDHTSFIREKLGFGPLGFGQVSGLEVGFAKHAWFGHAAVFNSPGGTTGGLPQDRHAKGVSATGGIKTGRFWLAGSVYDNRSGDVKEDYAGGYGALRLWKFTLLGEWDQINIEDRTDGAKLTGSAAYAELDFRPVRGVNAKLKYDRCRSDDGICDSDDDVRDDQLDRYTVGVEFYPYPFTEVILQYRINKEDPETRNDRTIAMVHFYY